MLRKFSPTEYIFKVAPNSLNELFRISFYLFNVFKHIFIICYKTTQLSSWYHFLLNTNACYCLNVRYLFFITSYKQLYSWLIINLGHVFSPFNIVICNHKKTTFVLSKASHKRYNNAGWICLYHNSLQNIVSLYKCLTNNVEIFL